MTITRSVVAALFVAAVALLAINRMVPQAQQSSGADCSELSVVKDRLKHLENYVRDWPNLNYYKSDNSRVTPPAKNETRVVFMGDSNTDYWDNPGYGGFFPGKPYINRGISGQITAQMLIRFRSDVIALQPKVVVILAGTNDIAGESGPTRLPQVKDNLASMVELARSNSIRVVLASLLPVNDYSRTPNGKQLIRSIERPAERIRTVNDWIKDYVERKGLTHLDYYSAVVDDKGMLKADFTDDGVHPNARGYAVMAPLAESAISRALRKVK